MKSLKNIESKNEEQLEVIKDQEEKQLNEIKKQKKESIESNGKIWQNERYSLPKRRNKYVDITFNTVYATALMDNSNDSTSNIVQELVYL